MPWFSEQAEQIDRARLEALMRQTVEEAGGFSSLMLARYAYFASGAVAAWPLEQYAPPAMIDDEQVLRAANVGYVAVDAERASPLTHDAFRARGWRQVDAGGGLIVYALPMTMPRAYWVGRAETVGTLDEAITRFRAPSFDVAGAVVRETEDVTPPALDASGYVPGDFRRPSNWEIEVDVDAPAPGHVVIAETAYPGWRATLDGVPVRWWIANVAFRGIDVPAGRHRVRMVYNPMSFRLGWWAMGATACALAVAGAASYAPWRRRA